MNQSPTNFHGQHLVTVEEFHKLAVSLMDQNTKGYYEAGAEDEITLHQNMNAFNNIIFRPRFMVDVKHVDTSTTILGYNVSLPFGFSPSGFHRLCHDDGEKATALAAKKAGICMCLSNYATYSLEEVAQTCEFEGLRFFHLSMTENRTHAANIMKKAKAAGYKAIVLTVDAQTLGLRIVDEHNKFRIPAYMTLPNFPQPDQMKIESHDASDAGGSLLHKLTDAALDLSLNWDDIDWIKKTSELPCIVKGILTAEDAELALYHKVDGVVVSNHGGRQADGCLATIEALPEIVEVLKGTNVEIYIDGGIRKGSDIFKALALGAHHVFLGRAVLYGLTVGGEEGVTAVVEILKSEFIRMMRFAGVTKINQITSKSIQYKK